jgi:serine/threonine protein kinase
VLLGLVCGGCTVLSTDCSTRGSAASLDALQEHIACQLTDQLHQARMFCVLQQLIIWTTQPRRRKAAEPKSLRAWVACGASKPYSIAAACNTHAHMPCKPRRLRQSPPLLLSWERAQAASRASLQAHSQRHKCGKGLLSSAVADVLRSMLHADPAQRITARQLLQHPWLQTHMQPGRL